MTYELKGPAHQEKQKCPTPVEKKQWQRNNDQGNADAVRQLVERMPMFRFVVFDERFWHLTFWSALTCQRFGRSRLVATNWSLG